MCTVSVQIDLHVRTFVTINFNGSWSFGLDLIQYPQHLLTETWHNNGLPFPLAQLIPILSQVPLVLD